MAGIQRLLRAKKAVLLIFGLLGVLLVYMNWKRSNNAIGPGLRNSAGPRPINSVRKRSKVLSSMHNIRFRKYAYDQKSAKLKHAYFNTVVEAQSDDIDSFKDITEDQSYRVEHDEHVVEGNPPKQRRAKYLHIPENDLAEATELENKTYGQHQNEKDRAGQYVEGDSSDARLPEYKRVLGMVSSINLPIKETALNPPLFHDETKDTINEKQPKVNNDVGITRKKLSYERQMHYYNIKNRKKPDVMSDRDLNNPANLNDKADRLGNKVHGYRKYDDSPLDRLKYVYDKRQELARSEVISENTLSRLLQAQQEENRHAIMDPKRETGMNVTFKDVGKTIVIIGYHRTGSTLLGTTLKEYPGTFYLFEIFHLMHFVNELTFMNGTKIYNIWKSFHQVEAHVLSSLLSCELDQLPLELLMDHHHVDHSDSLKNMVYCLQRVLSEQFDNTITEIMEGNVNNSANVIRVYADSVSKLPNAAAILNSMTSRCLAPAIQACKKAPVRVYKCIKLRMSAMPNALRDTDNVKVVHLLRDPRGNVISQARLLIPRYSRATTDIATYKYGYRKSFVAIANSYCLSIRNDIMLKNKLFDKYGENRIFTVLYERFATLPLETTRRLYKFADLDLSNEIEDYLWHLTMSGLKKACSYCVERGNGTIAAFGWRKYITPNQLMIIDKICDDVYDMVGVRKLPTISNVKNTKEPILV